MSTTVATDNPGGRGASGTAATHRELEPLVSAREQLAASLAATGARSGFASPNNRTIAANNFLAVVQGGEA
jgi:hypothetical protein